MQGPGCLWTEHHPDLLLCPNIKHSFTFTVGRQLWFIKISQEKKSSCSRNMTEEQLSGITSILSTGCVLVGSQGPELPLARPPAFWGQSHILSPFLFLGPAWCLVQKTNFEVKSGSNVCSMNVIWRVTASGHSIPGGEGSVRGIFCNPAMPFEAWQPASIQQVQSLGYALLP